MSGETGISNAYLLFAIPSVMFNFLKRILGTSGEKLPASESTKVSAPAAATPRPAEKPAGGMEVASLTLRSILEKFPPDLKAMVNQLPDSAVKVVLPVNAILKQLASGAVKMSLASLVRQSPPGVFRKADIEEKRMVDVPLSEVFKTVNPARLQRRADQRQYDVPENAAGLFGQNGQARNVTPLAQAPVAVPAAEPEVAPVAEPASEVRPESTEEAAPVEAFPKPEPMRVLKMPGLTPSPEPASATAPSPTSAQPSKSNIVAKVEPRPEPKWQAANGELVLSFVEIASTWPEGVRAELTMLTGDTRLVLPVSAVAPGLQKGKLAFRWSQVKQWFRPALKGAVAIPEDLDLVFPLKIVAPAFVAANGSAKRRENVTVDQTLPDFFGPSAGKTPAPVAAAKAPEEEAPPMPKPVAQAKPDSGAAADFSLVRAPSEQPETEDNVAFAREPEPVVEPPPVPAGALQLSITKESLAAPNPAPRPVAEEPTIADPLEGAPTTLATLFGQAEKPSWTPAELVTNTCRLPGVVGAVVALEEGLVVAQILPDGFAAETFAAFMPQIFGKLERYVQEMNLGPTNEITIHSANGTCHFARCGKVYLATLGQPGGTLPAGLSLIPAELAAHHH